MSGLVSSGLVGSGGWGPVVASSRMFTKVVFAAAVAPICFGDGGVWRCLVPGHDFSRAAGSSTALPETYTGTAFGEGAVCALSSCVPL